MISNNVHNTVALRIAQLCIKFDVIRL